MLCNTIMAVKQYLIFLKNLGGAHAPVLLSTSHWIYYTTYSNFYVNTIYNGKY